MGWGGSLCCTMGGVSLKKGGPVCTKRVFVVIWHQSRSRWQESVSVHVSGGMGCWGLDFSHCTTKSTSDIHTYLLFVSHTPSPLRCSLTPVSVQDRGVGLWERTIDRRPLLALNSFLISWHNRLAVPPPERTHSVYFLLSKFFFFFFFGCTQIILQSSVYMQPNIH